MNPNALQTLKAYCNKQPSPELFEKIASAGYAGELDLSDLDARMLRGYTGYDVETSERIKKAAAGDYEYGCLMLPVPFDLGRQLVTWATKKIREDALTSYGIEYQPHITIAFGFPSDFDVEQLRPFLRKYKDLSARLKRIDRFSNEEFDVIKFQVISTGLRRFNAELRDKFKITTSYPDYNPHLTIAYVRKGAMKELDEVKKFNDTLIVNTYLLYTGPNNTRYKLYLESETIVSQ